MPNVSVRLSFRIPCGSKTYVMSERHYLVNQTTLDAVAQTPRVVTDLAHQRAFCLGAGGLMLQTLVYADDDARNALVFDAPPVGSYVGVSRLPCYNSLIYSPDQNGGIAPEADFGYSDLLVTKHLANGGSAQYYMAGWPDAWQDITRNKPLATPQYNHTWDTWKTLLCNGNYGSLSIAKGNANPQKPVGSIAYNTQTSTYTVTCQNHGFASGDLVIIAGGKIRIPNAVVTQRNLVIPLGYNFVDVIDVNSFSVRGFTPAYPIFSYLGGAKAKKYTRTVSRYTNLTAVSFTSRKRGASLFSPRGRRKTRR